MAARAEKRLAQRLFLLACRKISLNAALGNAWARLERSHIGGEFPAEFFPSVFPAIRGKVYCA